MDSQNANSSREAQEMDEFDVSSLWPAYFDLCRKDLREMEQSLAAGNFERIRILGHNLKGSGSAYGFPALTEWGKGLEQASKEGNAEEIATCLAGVRDFLSSR